MADSNNSVSLNAKHVYSKSPTRTPTPPRDHHEIPISPNNFPITDTKQAETLDIPATDKESQDTTIQSTSPTTSIIPLVVPLSIPCTKIVNSPKPSKTIVKKRKPNLRCNVCRKKLGYTGFDCKCGMFFCGTHRYFDKHSCSFDYLTADKEILIKANPCVIARKMETI